MLSSRILLKVMKEMINSNHFIAHSHSHTQTSTHNVCVIRKTHSHTTNFSPINSECQCVLCNGVLTHLATVENSKLCSELSTTDTSGTFSPMRTQTHAHIIFTLATGCNGTHGCTHIWRAITQIRRNASNTSADVNIKNTEGVPSCLSRRKHTRAIVIIIAV